MQLFFDVFDLLLLPPRARRALTRAEMHARVAAAARTRFADRASMCGPCVCVSL